MVTYESEKKSPREVGADRAREALIWLRRWGWSSPSVLDIVTSATRRGLVARLERAKMVETIELDFYSIAIAPLPKKLVKLSDQGLELAESLFESNVIYSDIARPKPNDLLHDIKVQELAAKNISEGAKLVNSDPELRRKIKSGKIIDFIIEKDGKKIGIELELSKKREDEFCHGIESVCEAIKNKKIDGVIVYCATESIAKRYSQAFIPGNIMDKYVRAENRHYKKTSSSFTVPNVIYGAVKIVVLS